MTTNCKSLTVVVTCGNPHREACDLWEVLTTRTERALTAGADQEGVHAVMGNAGRAEVLIDQDWKVQERTGSPLIQHHGISLEKPRTVLYRRTLEVKEHVPP